MKKQISDCTKSCLFLVTQKLRRDRHGGPAIEFALTALALITFLMGILNLGLLGYTISALARGVQSAARTATVSTANSYATSTSYIFTCPTYYSSNSSATTADANSIVADFNNAIDGVIPPAGNGTGNPILTANWTNNNGTTPSTTEPPGLYLVLSVSYNWQPIGIPAFLITIPLKITTLATVLGSKTVHTSC